MTAQAGERVRPAADVNGVYGLLCVSDHSCGSPQALKGPSKKGNARYEPTWQRTSASYAEAMAPDPRELHTATLLKRASLRCL